MGKLLAWGDALFLVRCELGKLQLQRVIVDAEEKKASLRPCSVQYDGESAALPTDARLVAAKEVEDAELATRYAVLIFQASQDIAMQSNADSSPASQKRRRSTENKMAVAPEDDAEESMMGSGCGECLFFCVLHETESGKEIEMRLLNVLEIPTRSDEAVAAAGKDLNTLQVFLMDGPFVLLFERCSQLATVLKLQRATEAGGGSGFYVWREHVDVVDGIKGDASAPFELASCAEVFELITDFASCDLVAFNHVGHAHTGNFDGIHKLDASCQLLLLNDVPGIIDSSTCRIGSEVSIDKSEWGDGQLLKRSVLIAQKAITPETKLYCHRLRLREEKKAKHGSDSRKRSRDEKSGSKGLKPEPFHYIERTQRASSRDRNAIHFEDETNNTLAASQSQLGKVADSLFARVTNGLQELKRLQMIMGDKHALACKLNQLIAQQWQKQQTRASHSKDRSLLTLIHSTQEDGNFGTISKTLVDMETIVSAPSRTLRNPAKDETKEHVPGSSMGDPKLEQQVSLEHFRVVEYVPSSSLIHAEVVLKNLSGTILNDSFVVLTAPKRVPTQGWRCSCSVVPEFSPVADKTDHTTGAARFQLELQFRPSFPFLRERRPVEVTLWLHWGASRDDVRSDTTLAWRPSASALAVASVKIHPDDVLSVGRESLTNIGVNWCHGSSSKDHEQLLFISSGSNLGSWFRHPRFGVSTSVASVIRPTFALVSLDVRSHELLMYELSRMVANLPSDVYVMHNPLQHTHLRALQRVLRSMRQEILATQQRNSEEKLVKEYGTQRKQIRKTTASLHRSIQRDTDLQVNQLLQELQKRVNFHAIWFDVSTV
ncbi:hypothetical protein PHYPSEUDO_006973 [Phytophthora pseudosyringae]|uniref:Uncharacterized protein n=1 Tax=Phytophthora pseudosyringae TaxID=221518 RepID=A0A8T1VHC5_9STRA|nr:hypothetical protein PHYPSEUDO_006973 [Phytophthora pseudosyringae]